MNSYLDLSLDERISKFQERFPEEREYCEFLFEYATVRLLSHKYAYYELNDPYLHDVAYDAEEKSWLVMGRALGLLKEDEISPCVDFNQAHPLAEYGKELALILTGRQND